MGLNGMAQAAETLGPDAVACSGGEARLLLERAQAGRDISTSAIIDGALTFVGMPGAPETVGAALRDGRISIAIGQRQPHAFDLRPLGAPEPTLSFALDPGAVEALRACAAPATPDPGAAAGPQSGQTGIVSAAAPALPLHSAAPADAPAESCTALVASGGFTGPSQRFTGFVEPATMPMGGVFDWPMPHGEVREDFYTSGDDRILLVGDDTWVSSVAGAGDDVAVVFGAAAGNMPVGGTGSDVVHLCSIAGARFYAALGDGQGVASDSTPDTLVIHPDALRDAEALGGVEILTLDIDPRTDRIVVRSPQPPQVATTRDMLGWTLQIGPIRINNPIWSAPEPIDPAAAVAWTAASPGETADGLDLAAVSAAILRGEGLATVNSGSGLAEAHPDGAHGLGDYVPYDDHAIGHFDQPLGGDHGISGSPVRDGEDRPGSLDLVTPGAPIDGCGTLTAPSRLSALGPHGEYYDIWNSAAWGEGDDTLIHRGDHEVHLLDAGGGDDVVFLVAPGNETELLGGPGADIVVLCGLEDVNATIVLDQWEIADTAPDTLVLTPEVFEGIPEGYERKIVVAPFLPAVDRIYVPPGVGAPELDFQPFNSTLRFGRVVLELGLLPDPRPRHGDGVTGRDILDAVRTLAPDADLVSLAVSGAAAAPPSTYAIGGVGGRMLSGAAAGLSLPEMSCDADRIGEGPPPDAAPGVARVEPSRIGYGPADDVIVHRTDRFRPESWPGHESLLHAGAGDDRITVFGSDIVVDPGPGADVVLYCGGGAGITLSLLSPPDDAVDVVVLSEAVFAPTGLPNVPRRISIEGLGDPGDRLVLQLPPGATVTEERSHLLVEHDGQPTGIWTAGAYPDFESILKREAVILWQ